MRRLRTEELRRIGVEMGKVVRWPCEPVRTAANWTGWRLTAPSVSRSAIRVTCSNGLLLAVLGFGRRWEVDGKPTEKRADAVLEKAGGQVSDCIQQFWPEVES